MDRTQICFCCLKNRQILIIWLFLFASTSIFTHIVFKAEGRAISNLIEVSQKGMKERESIMVAKTQIGSRPPKCERRCVTCAHCEAVQVPTVPQFQSHRNHYSATKTATTVTYSREDDLSNYKPMSWKCKCGDYFFNP